MQTYEIFYTSAACNHPLWNPQLSATSLNVPLDGARENSLAS